ncbi:hypothetical protein CCR94_20285 [Rhodoblastus sphagnicola]|uniref:Uncharacterized protein n=1 Tax=Rhodoblastus sphagnicola TaxID=333368 RepID=A0A2S6MXW2_9HYPH|nr:hypothetical protein [Rhodoblastus sphagnicola]MBB4196657.1 hypothetical protein [Rhodoblastus sphagnicola]PPQ27179.1 hypothetical protein CCR94_20285 [Rhodoblastus sphagnicola]
MKTKKAVKPPVADNDKTAQESKKTIATLKPAKPVKVKADKAAKEEKKPINFKVSADFRREFKTYASAHDMKLSKLLELAFDSYRKQKGD